jgi:hypothetical protein
MRVNVLSSSGVKGAISTKHRTGLAAGVAHASWIIRISQSRERKQ